VNVHGESITHDIDACQYVIFICQFSGCPIHPLSRGHLPNCLPIMGYEESRSVALHPKGIWLLTFDNASAADTEALQSRGLNTSASNMQGAAIVAAMRWNETGPDGTLPRWTRGKIQRYGTIQGCLGRSAATSTTAGRRCDSCPTCPVSAEFIRIAGLSLQYNVHAMTPF
jgi:hypothetical protein